MLDNFPDFLVAYLIDMVVPLVAHGIWGGIPGVPYAYTLLKTLPWIGLVVLLKVYFGGAKNRSERVMHGKVVMVTVSDTTGIECTREDLLTRLPREGHQASALPSCKLSPLEEPRLFS